VMFGERHTRMRRRCCPRIVGMFQVVRTGWSHVPPAPGVDTVQQPMRGNKRRQRDGEDTVGDDEPRDEVQSVTGP